MPEDLDFSGAIKRIICEIQADRCAGETGRE